MNISDLQKLVHSSKVAAINQHIQLSGKTGQLKKAKYGNQKVEMDGHKFDSKKEARRYIELRAMQSVGEITCLNLQVPFQLSVCKYIADFTYKNKSNDLVVEDVKSAATRRLSTYRLKKKMIENELGIVIEEK